MNKEQEWRGEREHITDMPYCWCNPLKEVQPNGEMVIIHNYGPMTWKMEIEKEFNKKFGFGTWDSRAVDGHRSEGISSSAVLNFVLTKCSQAQEDERKNILKEREEAYKLGIKYGQAKQLKRIREIVEGMKKGVLDLFPNANIKLPTQELAEQVSVKNGYNQALSDITELLSQKV